MSEALNTFLLIVGGLFPIVNPLGSAPVFLNLTRSCTRAQRNRLAWRVGVNGFALLLGSYFLGSYVLEFFGFTLPVVRVAGGIIVTVMGWKLLTEGEDNPDLRAANETAIRGITPDGFYPLTMPLTVGPGSISVAITFGSHRPELVGHVGYLLPVTIAAVLALLVISISVFLSYRFATHLASFLGKGGTNVLIRLSAFILMCIGIEILWSGYSALNATLSH